MSHISKLDEVKKAKKLGYKTYLYFICLDSPLLNISRVENRVSKGGHSVNTQKIVSRYSSTLNNLLSALRLFDKSFLFDNSKEMLLIAEANNEELTLHLEEHNLPDWFSHCILDYSLFY